MIVWKFVSHTHCTSDSFCQDYLIYSNSYQFPLCVLPKRVSAIMIIIICPILIPSIESINWNGTWDTWTPCVMSVISDTLISPVISGYITTNTWEEVTFNNKFLTEKWTPAMTIFYVHTCPMRMKHQTKPEIITREAKNGELYFHISIIYNNQNYNVTNCYC